MMEAMHYGAIVRNYCEVLQILVRDGHAAGIRYRDRLSKKEGTVSARWVVNATGPWADRVCDGLGARRMVGGVKGSHIILRRWTGAPETPIYTEAADGRRFFAVPWANQVMVGTTEIAHDGDPADAQVTHEEIDYLLTSLRALLPQAAVSANDIRGAYAGVRALPYSPGAPKSAITRRSIIHDHLEDGVAHLLTIIGGKLSTAASLARQCADKMGIRLPLRDPLVALGCGDGVASALCHWTRSIARTTTLSEATALAIAEWHGRSAAPIVHLAGSSAEMRRALCPHTSHIAAEAYYAFQCERATSLADVLLRRVPVALDACWTNECAQHAADAIASVVGWNERTRAAQLDKFEEERAKMLSTNANLFPAAMPECKPQTQAQSSV
jgi:glycerol-3-phosphate dehydrogenase